MVRIQPTGIAPNLVEQVRNIQFFHSPKLKQSERNCPGTEREYFSAT